MKQSTIQAKDDYFMQCALDQAKLALCEGEVPIGAVIVNPEGKIIGSGFNQPIMSCDPSAHAEIIALRHAASEINNYRIKGASLYVTIEPCIMCLGAMVHARIQRLIFGAKEPRAGSVQSHWQLLNGEHFNHPIQFSGGIKEHACSQLITDFFRQRRQEKKADKKFK